jgi:riboflavin synthase
MFTGIIEEIGTVRTIQKGPASSKLVIQGNLIFSDLKLGDSVSTNGVCLTVAEIQAGSFVADVMHETLMRSSLGELRQGDSVNLERAMAADGRFGGHIVSGHIDGTGRIISVRKDDNAIWYKICTEAALMKYIVEKGSITVDGISLTVAAVEKDNFSVSIIPHTASHTILSQKGAGDKVNLENDLIGKYVERLLSFDQKPMTAAHNSLTKEKILQYGF